MECVWLYDLILAVTCLPARRVWAAGNGGGRWKGRRGCCCCWMLLSHIPLTQVGDSSPAGRASGQSGKRDSHQSKFTFFISPTNLFLFKHHFFLSGTQFCLALNTTALCVNMHVCVCVCECGLIPCNPKTFLSFFFFFLKKSGFQSRKRAEPFCLLFFYPELVMSAAHDRGGFGPICVYNIDSADFLLSSNFSIICPLANSNYNSLDGIWASYTPTPPPPPTPPPLCVLCCCDVDKNTCYL